MHITRHKQFTRFSVSPPKLAMAVGVIILSALCCASIAYVYISKIATPQFTATAILEWNTHSPATMPSAAMPMSLSQDNPEIQSQVERIKSPPFLLDIIHRHQLTDNVEFNPLLRPDTLITQWQDRFGLSFGIDADPNLATLTELQSKLDVLHIPSTNLIQVSLTTSNKDLSTQITNDIIDQFVASREAQHISRTQNAMGLLTSRIDALDT